MQGWYPTRAGAAGWFPNSYTEMTPQEEATMIRKQIEMMEQNIGTAKERLEELESD
jgi:uncharacterized protein YycO